MPHEALLIFHIENIGGATQHFYTHYAHYKHAQNSQPAMHQGMPKAYASFTNGHHYHKNFYYPNRQASKCLSNKVSIFHHYWFSTGALAYATHAIAATALIRIHAGTSRFLAAIIGDFVWPITLMKASTIKWWYIFIIMKIYILASRAAHTTPPYFIITTPYFVTIITRRIARYDGFLAMISFWLRCFRVFRWAFIFGFIMRH